MSAQPRSPHLRRTAFSLIAAGALVAGVLSNAGPSQAATTQPCDIYAAGSTPCVAAHSTTRALFGAYNGALYQVRRSSDNTTRDIAVVSRGGPANAAAQDSFCSGTSCVITIVYDQSGRGNNLGYQGPGGIGGADHDRRPQGLRRLRGGRDRLPQQQHQRHRHR